MTRLACLLLVSLVRTFAPLGASAGEAEWKVGLARAKITPEWQVFLVGYTRTQPFTRVESDLFVKALVLEDRQGQRAVLVTSDLIGFTTAVAEPICARLRDKLGLQRSQILLNASHTHTGPALSVD